MAIFLVCVMLALYTDLEHRNLALRGTAPAHLFETVDRHCECAIRLVYLGTDCQVTLQLSPVNSDF
jgi:hypothetical protein